MAICKPERELTPDTRSEEALILDFQDFRTLTNTLLLFKPPSLLYSITAELSKAVGLECTPTPPVLHLCKFPGDADTSAACLDATLRDTLISSTYC